MLATTDGPLDPLRHHQTIRQSGWNGRVTPTFRPDSVVDPEAAGFADRVAELGEITGERSDTWSGYLRALASRRSYFASLGATSSLVMQLHPGSWRNHNPSLFEAFGADKSADIPVPTNYVRALKPLLDRFGNDPGSR